ncbi:cell growth regulator with RING finger domain protein 1-like [Haliotis rubra]|uniref:cell growth regulator with RING finger domain protein 1-like n=1 Tax=Haliotis rubra TaxID=36100 RepID=UPI001EE5F345|nr:cell growth regulator with RING finger domain protein 1-like [Haliotis rubra]
MDVIDVIQDVLCLSLFGTELLDMADDLSHLLYSFANYSNHYAIITVLLCFVATAVLILRFNNDFPHFPILPPSPPNSAIQTSMKGCTNPFSILLQDAAITTLKGGFSLSVSSLTEGHLSVFWGTSINTVHEVLQWSPEAILKDLSDGQLLQGNESLHSQHNIRADPGTPPRQRYPCVVIAATSGGNPGTPAVVASFTMLHLRDSVVTMESQMVGQYLKLSDGRVFSLQALYLATDNENLSPQTSSTTRSQASSQASSPTRSQASSQASSSTRSQASSPTRSQASSQASSLARSQASSQTRSPDQLTGYSQASSPTRSQASSQASSQTRSQASSPTRSQASSDKERVSSSQGDTGPTPSVEPCASCETGMSESLDGSVHEEETRLCDKCDHLRPCGNKPICSCYTSSTEVQSVLVSSSSDGDMESAKTHVRQWQSGNGSNIEPRLNAELLTEPIKNDHTTVTSSTSAMDEDIGHECVVCQMNPISHVILPCRHACACSMCFKKIDRCPMCRGFIETYFTMFDDGQSEEVNTEQDEVRNDQTGFVAWIENMNDRLNEYLGFT